MRREMVEEEVRESSGEEEEEEEDRLSSLPDDILYHILSFLDTKYAVQTSALLSKRWTKLWISLPDLNFDSSNYTKVSSFNHFIYRFLNSRDDSAKINSLKFRDRNYYSPLFFKKVIKHVTSHGVQSLEISGEYKGIYDFPACIYSSDSLKTLKLLNFGHLRDLKTTFRCQNLASLHLEGFSFVDSFSGCPNLVDLTLTDCYLDTTLNISAPELTTLTTSFRRHMPPTTLVLSAPKLNSFNFYGTRPPVLLCADELLLLDTVSIHADMHFTWREPNEQYQKLALELITMLQRFHNAKSVTLSLRTAEFLNAVPSLLASEPSPFANLKSLKFIASGKCLHSSSPPIHVITYLLKNSPGADIVMELPRCEHCDQIKSFSRNRLDPILFWPLPSGSRR